MLRLFKGQTRLSTLCAVSSSGRHTVQISIMTWIKASKTLLAKHAIGSLISTVCVTNLTNRRVPIVHLNLMLDFHFWIWSSFGLLPGEKVLTQGKKEKFQKKTCSKLVSFRFFCLSNFGLEMPFLCFELQDLIQLILAILWVWQYFLFLSFGGLCVYYQAKMSLSYPNYLGDLSKQ